MEIFFFQLSQAVTAVLSFIQTFYRAETPLKCVLHRRYKDGKKRSGDVTLWPDRSNGCTASLNRKRSRVKIPTSQNEEDEGLSMLMYCVSVCLML